MTSSYVYDREDILREVRGATTLSYVHGRAFDEPLAVYDGAFSYFHADGLGSIVKVTSASGVVNLTRQYDAWGNLETGAGEQAYAFTGREWDPETGLYYYRARYYDSRLGRFVSEDPIGIAGGINLHAYVSSQPTALTDPSGLTPACSNPCSQAKKLGLDEKDDGGVVCCGGKMYACSWKEYSDSTPDKAKQIMTDCTMVHETTHFPDSKCPCDGLTRADWRDKSQGNQSECKAHRATMSCLAQRRKECGSNPECVAAIDAQIAATYRQIQFYCNN